MLTFDPAAPAVMPPASAEVAAYVEHLAVSIRTPERDRARDLPSVGLCVHRRHCRPWTAAQRRVRATWASGPFWTDGSKAWYAEVDAAVKPPRRKPRTSQEDVDKKERAAAERWLRENDPMRTEDGCEAAVAAAVVASGLTLDEARAAFVAGRGRPSKARRAALDAVRDALTPLRDAGYVPAMMADVLGTNRVTLHKVLRPAQCE